jgi:hypothetical protein
MCVCVCVPRVPHVRVWEQRVCECEGGACHLSASEGMAGKRQAEGAPEMRPCDARPRPPPRRPPRPPPLRTEIIGKRLLAVARASRLPCERYTTKAMASQRSLGKPRHSCARLLASSSEAATSAALRVPCGGSCCSFKWAKRCASGGVGRGTTGRTEPRRCRNSYGRHAHAPPPGSAPTARRGAAAGESECAKNKAKPNNWAILGRRKSRRSTTVWLWRPSKPSVNREATSICHAQMHSLPRTATPAGSIREHRRTNQPAR